ALRPLNAFSKELTSRKANELTPVTLEQVPQELAPVLLSTNHLFERLSAAFAREKRFASDVAHELRTPLSVLEITLHNALTRWQQQGMSQSDESMQALRDGVDRMRQLIEQIMPLNCTQPDKFKAKMQTIDLAALCRDVVADCYNQLQQKQHKISSEGEEHLQINADAFALRLVVS